MPILQEACALVGSQLSESGVGVQNQILSVMAIYHELSGSWRSCITVYSVLASHCNLRALTVSDILHFFKSIHHF